MKRWAFPLLLSVGLAACGGEGIVDAADAAVPEEPDAGSRALTAIEMAVDSVLSAVNAARAVEGLPALTVDPALRAVAQAHAEDMARREYLDHVTPEGVTARERVAGVGLAPRVLAENISLHVSAADALSAWMDSRAHRANILLPAFGRTGVGVYWEPGRRSTAYFVQLFVD